MRMHARCVAAPPVGVHSRPRRDHVAMPAAARSLASLSERSSATAPFGETSRRKSSSTIESISGESSTPDARASSRSSCVSVDAAAADDDDSMVRGVRAR